MLKNLEPSDSYECDFVSADIENAEDGDLLCIGTTWRAGGLDGELQHQVYHSWEDWWGWVCEQAKTDKRFRCIYAHNGGGWDWVGFFEWWLKQRKDPTISVNVVTAQSKMILMDVCFLKSAWTGFEEEKPQTQYTIRLCDSLYLLRSKLETLAVKLLGAEWAKTETSIEDVWRAWQEDKPRFYRYLRRDCDALLLILEKSLLLLREHVGKIKGLGVTIGSTAMKVYRTMGMDSMSGQLTIPTEKKVKDFLREGYRGGRVEVFKYGFHKRIRVYDINSLYPTAMVTVELPVSGRGGFTSIYRRNLPGAYRVRFKQYRRDIFPVLMVGGGGAYEGEGVYFTPELNLLREVDPKAVIELIGDGYVFYDAGHPFNEYVHRLYNLRLTDKDGPISLLAKYLLNSLYGKFSQRARRKRLVIFSSREEAYQTAKRNRKKHLKFVPVRRDSLLYTVEEETDVDFEHVGIGGMITSQARVMLYRSIMKAGCSNVVYSDTDSIHCTSDALDGDIGTDLGMVKLESVGEAVYCGKKLYAIRDSEVGGKSKEKIRAKGVSVGGRNGFDLRFDDMVRISEGAKIQCEFSQPATVVQVMGGRMKACVLGKRNRKRTLKLT